MVVTKASILSRALELVLLRDTSCDSFDTCAKSFATLCLRCVVLSDVHLVFGLVDRR
jgi:hypothetical protein